MTWGDESDANDSKFKEVVLPAGFPDEPRNEVIGLTATAPKEEPAASAPRAARRLFDPAAGQATWNRQLRPRHRAAVRRYFNSD